MREASCRIAVLGAGITGVSSALRIKRALPEAEVTVFAEASSPGTTSDVAAGFWGPAYIGRTPKDRILTWSKQTYDYLADLAKFHPESGRYGVFMAPGYELFSTDEPQQFDWSHIPIGFRRASPSELTMFPSHVRSGYFFVTAMAEPSKLIPHLMAEFQSLGGRVHLNHRISSFAEVKQLGYKWIVNCTGLGAKQLCQDPAVRPIRGQVIRAEAPWMKFWFGFDNDTYCLLNEGHVVLGGVAQVNNWNTEVSQQDKAAILARNFAIWPSLKEAKVLGDFVGLRPGREAVRLERETLEGRDGAEDCVIYHNYGHGGSGLTLFWGCAGSIVDLLLQDLGRNCFPKGRL